MRRKPQKQTFTWPELFECSPSHAIFGSISVRGKSRNRRFLRNFCWNLHSDYTLHHRTECLNIFLTCRGTPLDYSSFSSCARCSTDGEIKRTETFCGHLKNQAYLLVFNIFCRLDFSCVFQVLLGSWLNALWIVERCVTTEVTAAKVPSEDCEQSFAYEQVLQELPRELAGRL